MSFDDWVLALHVLSAFSLVAGIVLFWVIVVAVRRPSSAPTSQSAKAARIQPSQMS